MTPAVRAAQAQFDAAQTVLVERQIAVREMRDQAQAAVDAAEDAKADQLEAARAAALGEATLSVPTSADIDALELKAAGLRAAVATREAAVDAAENKVRDAEAALTAAIRADLNARREALLPHFVATLESAKPIGVEMMAIEHLLNTRFKDPASRRTYMTAEDLYGPVANLFNEFKSLDWPEWPYSLRPSWLPRYGSARVWELPGVREAESEILASLGEAAR